MEQRENQFVMPYDVDTSATAEYRSPDYIRYGPILSDHIYICRGKILNRMSEVPGNGYSFQEDFRHYNR